jgi:membrane-bound lytic murein transglycosylase D
MKLFILLFLATFHFVILFAQTQNQYEVLDSNEVYDMEVLHAKTEELLGYQITYLSNEEINTYIKYSADKLPPLTNEEIERKLKEIPTTLNFRFTPEIGDMIRYYLYKNRTYLVSMLSKGEYYFPLFDREFDKLNVPLELKYISIIESSLNPLAISPMGAGGLWQFTLSTAKYKGIKVNTLEDERKDPQISTEYAAAYLKQLYTIYDDWLLALSAYNAGSGNINKAIKAANGVKNYWVVRPYIPKETQVYVPKIIALSYALYYANEYYLFPRAPETTFDNLIQVKINESMSLLHIADLLGTSEDKLAQINPMLTKKIVPKKEGGFLIYIPSEYYSVYEEKFENLVNDPYLVNEHAEIEQKSVDEFQYVNKEKATFTSSNCKIHCVQSGESLGLLSKQYQCSVNELKKWNNLSSDLLRVGQNIKILTTENEATKTVEDLKINTTYYVLSGDNLGYIANKFNCSVDDLRKWNHLDNDMLKVGQKAFNKSYKRN